MARSAEECEAVAAEIGDASPSPATSATRRAVSGPSPTCRRGSDARACSSTRRASRPFRGRAERHAPATFAQIVDVNLAGAFAMIHAAAAALADGGGAVVNVASTLGIAASPLLCAYGASKAGLIHLTRTLAREWAADGVRVNAVCPGYVETDLTARMLADDAIREPILEATPMRRLAEMREIVAPALFLASDEASYITGAALLVDGGHAA